jgi:hypothetical protein
MQRCRAALFIWVLSVTFLLNIIASFNLAECKEKEQSKALEQESIRNAPPDTTPYIRKTVPEDYTPGGQDAIPPGVNHDKVAPSETTLPGGLKEPNKELEDQQNKDKKPDK